MEITRRLSGFLPFYSQSKEKTMTYCITGNFFLSGNPVLDALSNEAKDLISGLLCVDPDERFTFEQIINHPWLGQRKSSHTRLSLSSFKELKLESLTDLK